MTLIKTSLLNGIAVIIKMLTLFGINKVLAIYVGPSGYAVLGQFQNAVQMITTFASGAINTGVIKYTAEYQDEADRQHKVWQTAGTVGLVGSLVAAVVITIFNQILADWFLHDESYGGVFLWLSGALVLFTLNTLLLAILNGKKEIALYVLANSVGSVFSLAITTIMSVRLGLYGALVALAVYQSITFFVTLLLSYKAPWFKLSYLFGRVDKKTALNLAKYTAMALTTAACVPVSHILVRNHLGDIFGWDAAGYWEAMWRLSAAYLMLVTTTLSLYYLPRLSELKEPSEIRREIFQGYKVILPIAALSGLVIYLFRDFIIAVLFTKDFLPVRELFAWQMLGDTLKIASWMLGYVLTAKAFVGLYIFSEILFSFLFYLFVRFLSDAFGLESASIAHAINYFLHFLFMYSALRWKKVF